MPEDRSGSLIEPTYVAWMESGNAPELLPRLFERAKLLSNTQLYHVASFDMRRRCASGENASAKEYFERFPELENSLWFRASLQYDEYCGTVERGESISFDDFLSQHPRDAMALRVLNDIPAELSAELPFDQDEQVRLEGLLGRGGFCFVFRGVQQQLGRRVAVKMLAPEFLRSELAAELLARFQQEAAICGQVNHPHVVTVYAVGKHNEEPYLLMELLEGGSLADYREFAKPTPAEAARLVRDAARGVGAVHDQGTEHRDLKPDNLLFTREGQIKVVDFNLSRPLSNHDEWLWSRSKVQMGTPAYQAPEALMKSGDMLPYRADVYSLGVILFELASGQLPLGSRIEPPSTETVANTLPPPLSRVCPQASPELERIVNKCLKKRPAQRYENANQLADDLDRLLSGQSVKGAWRWSPTNRPLRSLTITALALLVIIAALAVVVGFVQRSRSRELSELQTAIGSLKFEADLPPQVWPERMQQVDARINRMRNSWLGYPEEELTRQAAQAAERYLFRNGLLQRYDTPEQRATVDACRVILARWSPSIAQGLPDSGGQWVELQRWALGDLETSTQPDDPIELQPESHAGFVHREFQVQTGKLPVGGWLELQISANSSHRGGSAVLLSREHDHVGFVDSGDVVLMNPSDGAVLQRFSTQGSPPANIFALSKDSTLVVTQAGDLIVQKHGRPLATPIKLQSSVRGAAISPGRKQLAVLLANGRADRIQIIALSEPFALGAAIELPGKAPSKAAVAINDSGIVWAAVGKQIHQFNAHGESVKSESTDSSVSHLSAFAGGWVSAHQNGELEIWRVGDEAPVTHRFDSAIIRLATSHDGGVGAATEGGEVWFWLAPQPPRQVGGSVRPLTAIGCEKDSNGEYRIAAADESGDVFLWECQHDAKPKKGLIISRRGLRFLVQRPTTQEVEVSLFRDGQALSKIRQAAPPEDATWSFQRRGSRLAVLKNDVLWLEHRDWSLDVDDSLPLRLSNSADVDAGYVVLRGRQDQAALTFQKVDQWMRDSNHVKAANELTSINSRAVREKDTIVELESRYRLALTREKQGRVDDALGHLAYVAGFEPLQSAETRSLAAQAAFHRWATLLENGETQKARAAFEQLQTRFRLHDQNAPLGSVNVQQSVSLNLLFRLRRYHREHIGSNKGVFVFAPGYLEEKRYTARVSIFLDEPQYNNLARLVDWFDAVWQADQLPQAQNLIADIRSRADALLAARTPGGVFPERAVERYSWYLRISDSPQAALAYLNNIDAHRRDNEPLPLLDLERVRASIAANQTEQAVDLLRKICDRSPAEMKYQYGFWAMAHEMLGFITADGGDLQQARVIWRNGYFDRWKERLPPDLQERQLEDEPTLGLIHDFALRRLNKSLRISHIAMFLAMTKRDIPTRLKDASKAVALAGVFTPIENLLPKLAGQFDFRPDRILNLLDLLHADLAEEKIRQVAFKQLGFSELYRGAVIDVLTHALKTDLTTIGVSCSQEELDQARRMFTQTMTFFYSDSEKGFSVNHAIALMRIWLQNNYATEWRPILDRLPDPEAVRIGYFFAKRFQNDAPRQTQWRDYAKGRAAGDPELTALINQLP